MQDFQKLVIWQRSTALAAATHDAVRRFPRAGYTTLKGQLTRSAESISTNIVEGCGSATAREFARYLDIAIKSANETQHHLLVARDRGALTTEVWAPLGDEVIQIRRMTFALRKRVLRDS